MSLQLAGSIGKFSSNSNKLTFCAVVYMYIDLLLVCHITYMYMTTGHAQTVHSNGARKYAKHTVDLRITVSGRARARYLRTPNERPDSSGHDSPVLPAAMGTKRLERS